MRRKLDGELTVEESNLVMNEIHEVIPTVIDKLVAIADKHNVVHDDVITCFGETFSVMAKISTFEQWGEGNEKTDGKESP